MTKCEQADLGELVDCDAGTSCAAEVVAGGARRLAPVLADWYKVTMATTPRRARIAVDLPLDVRRRVRIAAARRDMGLQDYVRRALDRQLEEDALDALDEVEDPVLAELWSDAENGVYDDL